MKKIVCFMCSMIFSILAIAQNNSQRVKPPYSPTNPNESSLSRPLPNLLFRGRNCERGGFMCIQGIAKNAEIPKDAYLGTLEYISAKKVKCVIEKSTIKKADLDILLKNNFDLKENFELSDEVIKSTESKIKPMKPRIIRPKSYIVKSENDQIIFEFELL
jgi:hypothetical protein